MQVTKRQQKTFCRLCIILKSDVFTAQKNLQAAEAELKKAIELDENYLPAYSAYASLLIARNQTDASRRTI